MSKIKTQARKQSRTLAHALKSAQPNLRVQVKASTLHDFIDVLHLSRQGKKARVFLDYNAQHAIVQTWTAGDRGGLSSFTSHDGESLIRNLARFGLL